MNQNNLVMILFLILVVFWIIKKRLDSVGVAKISHAEAKRRMDTEKGIVLLDVRTRREYLEKHLPKSILIPLDVLRNEASEKLPDKNTTIFVYCRSGSRSVSAVKILGKLGYINVYDLGGIVSWPYKTK